MVILSMWGSWGHCSYSIMLPCTLRWSQLHGMIITLINGWFSLTFHSAKHCQLSEKNNVFPKDVEGPERCDGQKDVKTVMDPNLQTIQYRYYTCLTYRWINIYIYIWYDVYPCVIYRYTNVCIWICKCVCVQLSVSVFCAAQWYIPQLLRDAKEKAAKRLPR